MRTQAELEAVLKKLKWFVDGPAEGIFGKGRYTRQDLLTQMNIIKAMAMLDWALGHDSTGNPVTAMLPDIDAMMVEPNRV